MASFTNQAQLEVGDMIIQSNIVTGEIVDALNMTKTSAAEAYGIGDTLTYILAITNENGRALNDISITDNLGAYTFGAGQTLYPLTYIEDSVRMFVNGELVAAPTVTAGPELVFSGIDVPAGASVLLVYNAEVNSFAPQGEDGVITNCATINGDGVLTPITVCETVTAEVGTALTITKAIEPVPVRDNDRLTYTFTIQNFGAAAVLSTDGAVLRDTFDPVLTDLTVTLSGEELDEGTDYTYSETSGEFVTGEGVITVPAATYAQDATTGAWIVTPGVAVLTVEGTI